MSVWQTWEAAIGVNFEKRYPILFIQHNTEDLRAVSLLDTSLPSNREDVVILGGVAVVWKSLLHEKETNKWVKIEKTDILNSYLLNIIFYQISQRHNPGILHSGLGSEHSRPLCF